MLDMDMATSIMNAARRRGINITLNEACQMEQLQAVPSSNSEGYTVLAVQTGSVTILAWIEIFESLGVRIRNVKAIIW